MPPPIEKSALKPCDILMCYGNSQPLSWILRHVDGGTYSHGALYYGLSPEREVIEARYRPGETGIYFLTLDELCQLSEFIDVYRYCGDNGETVPEAAQQAIQARADRFVDEAALYDVVYSMLLLIPSLVDRLDLEPSAMREARVEVDTLMAEVDRFIDGEQQRLVCTELVYLCYAEAFPDGRYTLKLLHSGKHVKERTREFSNRMPGFIDHMRESELPTGYPIRREAPDARPRYPSREEAVEHFVRSMVNPEDEEGAVEFLERSLLSLEPEPDISVPASSVTPKDLEKSPSLETIGRVHGTAS